MSESKPDPTDESPRILDLGFRLVEDVLVLLTERVALAEEELNLEIERVRSVASGVAVAAAALLVGFQLVNAAVVVGLHAAGVPLWAALLGLGLGYGGLGYGLLRARLARARRQGRLFDRSRRELERDREMVGRRA